jgi:hypothetical protein
MPDNTRTIDVITSSFILGVLFAAAIASIAYVVKVQFVLRIF